MNPMCDIKVMFLHADIYDFDNNNQKLEYLLFFLGMDKLVNKYNFVWDDESPDILFVSEHLYYGKNTNLVKNKFADLQKNNPINIFVAGECLEPDFNIFDYAIVFDRSLSLDDRLFVFQYF